MNDITYAGRHDLVSNVSRHRHETWEYVLCTHGSGMFDFGGTILRYSRGDVVIIPPNVLHSNRSEGGMKNIHINMASPTFILKEPAVISDDANHFLLDAFTAVLWHYRSDRKERDAFLALYGSLICTYLAAYQTIRVRPRVVEEIERAVAVHYADSDWELDTFLHSLPFSYDSLRKLFQKEMGVTPHRYLNDKRLMAAAETLAGQGSVSVAEVARSCGFREPLYFSKTFKKRFGVSPSAYQQMHQH